MHQQNPEPEQSASPERERLTLGKYDPDNSKYSIEEWLRDASATKEKLKVDDEVMILEVGEVLEGRAREFYENWKPSVRNWKNFENDLLVTFPDWESWHMKLLRAANMRSSDFNSIREYILEKVRSIARYCGDLPWERVLSPLVGGIDSSDVREFILLHQPKNQKELMLHISQYEAENSRLSSSEKIEVKLENVQRCKVESETDYSVNGEVITPKIENSSKRKSKTKLPKYGRCANVTARKAARDNSDLFKNIKTKKRSSESEYSIEKQCFSDNVIIPKRFKMETGIKEEEKPKKDLNWVKRCRYCNGFDYRICGCRNQLTNKSLKQCFNCRKRGHTAAMCRKSIRK